ncbi:MAG TPA: hypothetical protein VFU81_12465 [Thermomicrobiales bacterium]|nr:hypothetical protein [Thermomicrobiales bacterium]
MTTTSEAAPESHARGMTPAAGLPAQTAAFYRETLATLSAADAPFLVGGAYALASYTGVERHTKDLDVFVRAGDVDRTLAALAAAGCETELTFPHWLGKACRGDDFIDVIFSSGNGVAAVDDAWFAHAVPADILGLPVHLIPPEEMLWSKAFVLERERFDGADINHLLRVAELDWRRVLRRFGEQWAVLLAHLVLFRFVYPTDAGNVPAWAMHELLAREAADLAAPAPTERVCLGPLLSRAQYLIDIEEWGFRDPRLRANGGAMTEAEIRHWTAAIGH